MSLATLRIEDVAAHPWFRHLSTLDARIDVDLRYPTTNNFAGRVLYADWDCAWLRQEAAAGLEAAARWLAETRPGWRIRLLDALRPHRVQQAIWRDVVGTPLQDYFADPARGSIHSFGMAVDVTLVSPEGQEADMGSAFDEMTLRSHPSMNDEHLALGVLTAEQVTERGWLHAAMVRGGFRGIPTEWWHFDHGDHHARAALRNAGPRVD
jgi:zinc D-Ala-D-Ala dipeptidase